MFSSDAPIIRPEDDLLGRNTFAKQLAQTLLNLNTKDTFTIGLSGKWGSGKTSLVNMTLNELDRLFEGKAQNEKPIVVHFEPWNYADSSQLLTQFLSRLSVEFRSADDQRNINICQALETYSGAFDIANAIPGFGPVIAAIGKTGANALGKKLGNDYDEKDISKQKDHVCELLKKQPNKVIVIIDDIDRLSSIQIRQIFQLVSSVGKFPNTIYLLVFDEDIVIKSLESVQGGKGKDYLEKIIQIPIHIPDIQKDRLDNILFSQMDRLLSEYDGISFQANYWHTIYPQCVSPYISTIRDVNRLCNAVRFKLATIYKEVNFTDIVAITTIEIALPQVYTWIKQSKSALTGSLDISSIKHMYKTREQLYSIFSDELRLCLQSDLGHDVNEQDIKTVMDILATLFPYFASKISTSYVVHDFNELRRDNHISHADRFDRYFNLDLSPGDLPQSEIVLAAYYLDIHDLSQFLLEKDKEGTSYKLLEEIQALTPGLSSERAKTIITALVSTNAQLTDTKISIFFPLDIQTLLKYLVLELLKRVDMNERLPFMTHIINNGNTQSFSAIAYVLNTIELGYGRLAANGEETSKDKVISLDELIQLEDIFKQKVKSLLQENSLFIFDQWYIVSYLLECFDPNYIDGYLSKVLETDRNVLEYICSSIHVWKGGATEYEVKDEYKKYLTDGRVLQAIESERDSGRLFSLSDDVQSKSAAFYIRKKIRPDSHENIPQADVDTLLAEWKYTSSCNIHEHQHQEV